MRKLVVALLATIVFLGCATAVGQAQLKEEPRPIYLTLKNTLVFDNQIDIASIDMLLSAVVMKRTILPEDETLYILIASPGGQYGASKYGMTALSKLKAYKIELICKYCASGAALIFAGSELPRLALKNSYFMQHELSQVRVTADQLKDKDFRNRTIESSDEFDKLMADAVKLSLSDYKPLIAGKEWTLQGSQLVENNIADELVTVQCDKTMNVIAPNTCNGTD